MLRRHTAPLLVLVLAALVTAAACSPRSRPSRGRRPRRRPARRPRVTGPAGAGGRAGAGDGAAPSLRSGSSTLSNKSLDEINKQSPLLPVFYEFDSAEMSTDAQSALTKNAEVLKQNATWVVSIEGHCDERGTANAAPRARRAARARRAHLSRVARDRAGSAADRELRQGVPVRSRAQRDLVGQEPPRALRGHRQVTGERGGHRSDGEKGHA